MLPIDHRWLALRALQASDLAIFSLVLYLVLYVGARNAGSAAPGASWSLIGWFASSLVVWHLALRGAKAYRSHRLSGKFPAIEIFGGISAAALCVGALALLFEPENVRLNVVVHVWWISALTTLAARITLWWVLVILRKRGRNLRFVLIVGSGQRALTHLKHVFAAAAGYRVIGYVDDLAQDDYAHLPGIRYLGTVDVLPKILASEVIDEVFVFLPMRSQYDSTLRVIQRCEEQGIPVRIPCDIFVPGHCGQFFDIIDGTPILSLVPSAVSGWYIALKRVADVIVSATLLILLAPLFIAVAVLIKHDSPGPVFFVQKRVGMHKRLFPMIKFRTMCVNSEAMLPRFAHLNEADGPVFKIHDDPRVTRLGHFLRSSSIDELPQLINVLVGHMSLVGPRPLPLRDVEGFQQNWQRRRFSVRPGITCLWQISGRSSIPFNRWMELDMLYIEQRSLLLDFKILLQTIPAVLKKGGAY
jgi:exopolysaccharide biosynthesis polyprenyl glycosylphosphotransferase